MRKIIRSLDKDLKECSQIDIKESFIDGTFVRKKRIPNEAWEKGTKIMEIEDGNSLPIPFARKMLPPLHVIGTDAGQSFHRIKSKAADR